jgi:glutaredoxin
MVLEDLYEAGERPIVHHVDKDPSIRTLMLMAGLKTVPQVFAPDGYHIGGYQETIQWLIDKDMDDSNDPY